MFVFVFGWFFGGFVVVFVGQNLKFLVFFDGFFQFLVVVGQNLFFFVVYSL